MTFAWTDRWPANRAPEVNGLTTEAREAELAPGTRFTARLDATDPEGDPLVVRWEIRSESADRREGGDRETSPRRTRNASSRRRVWTPPSGANPGWGVQGFRLPL